MEVFQLEDMLTQLMHKIISGEGGIATIVLVIVSNILSALGARYASKDKRDSEILDKTMNRQQELDNLQKEVLDQFKGEISRMKIEMASTQEEINTRRRENDNLHEKNQQLLSEINATKMLALNTENTLKSIIRDRDNEIELLKKKYERRKENEM